MSLLAVYGTLMGGYAQGITTLGRNHAKFLSAERFIDAGRTLASSFEMVAQPSRTTPGKFTPVVFAAGGKCIQVELYNVDAPLLAQLDELEGTHLQPPHYVRRPFLFQFESSSGLVEADMYVAPHQAPNIVPNRAPIDYKGVVARWRNDLSL